MPENAKNLEIPGHFRRLGRLRNPSVELDNVPLRPPRNRSSDISSSPADSGLLETPCVQYCFDEFPTLSGLVWWDDLVRGYLDAWAVGDGSSLPDDVAVVCGGGRCGRRWLRACCPWWHRRGLRSLRRAARGGRPLLYLGRGRCRRGRRCCGVRHGAAWWWTSEIRSGFLVRASGRDQHGLCSLPAVMSQKRHSCSLGTRAAGLSAAIRRIKAPRSVLNCVWRLPMGTRLVPVG